MNIDDESIKKIIRDNVIVTGGAIVSLLTGEELHDYDVYFRTKEACVTVATYYVGKWNEKHPDKPVSVRCDDKTGKIDCFVSSTGIADEEHNFASTEEEIEEALEQETENEKYRPRFITSNAITLTDKVQLVIRFYGEVEEIHKNYDFAHCTCAWSSWDNELFLPEKHLNALSTRSCTISDQNIRYVRLFGPGNTFERGYHINAGQYVKMCFQLNELDLKDVKVLEDQLTGVDTTYFKMMVDAIQKHMEETGEERVDATYAMNLINKLF